MSSVITRYLMLFSIILSTSFVMFGFQNCGKSSFKLRGGIDNLSGLNADDDADGLSNGVEQAGTTDPQNPDSDGDGLLDGEEVNTHGTDPMNPDSDGGGMNDGDEVNSGTDPAAEGDDKPVDPPADQDTDNDGLTDVYETTTSATDPNNPDSDDDGLLDGEEVNTHQTNPLNPDTDGGSVQDGLEVANGTNPKDNPSDDAGLDTDNDGLLDNYETLTSGTDPNNPDTDGDGLQDGEEVAGPGGNSPTDPKNKDTDGDGLEDGAEVNTHGSNPNNKDTDGGGMEDGAEVTAGKSPTNKQDDTGSPFADDDNDGLTNIVEQNLGTDPQDPDTDDDGLIDGPEVLAHSTDPKNPDTDGGGVNDGEEVNTNNTNPNDPADDKSDPNEDSDEDGLTDAIEASTGTDPNDKDSDDDGLTDGAEVLTHGTNPLDPDTDKGGVNDGTEVMQGSDPKANPADDKMDPNGDDDNDGLTNAEEATIGTNPHDPDTDDDGLKDGAEVNTHKTDPKNSDTDEGGVNDGVEVARGSDPKSKVDDLIQSSNCTPYKGIAVWSDAANTKLTATSMYLGNIEPYKSDTTGYVNYGYDSNSANPKTGPAPEAKKLKVFLHEGMDGLMATFYVNKDEAAELPVSLQMNVTTNSNNGSDKLIFADEMTEMKRVSSVSGVNKYTVNMSMNKNSDGAVFGPFNSKSSLIHFELLNSENVDVIEVHSLDGKVYDMNGTHFIIGYRDYMSCACDGGNQKITFTNMPQAVGVNTSGEIMFDTTFGSDVVTDCTINDVSIPGGCFVKNPVNFNKFYLGEHEFKIVAQSNEGVQCEAKFKWEIKGGACIDCEPPVLLDDDKDGLTNAEEEEVGTDPNNPDTDGDSLKDGAEVKEHKSNPLEKDTDKGGVEDGAEVQRGSDPTKPEDDEGDVANDDDSDGLSNEDEVTAGTDPKNPDTDGDGLKDGPEVKKYKTDPKNDDTDGGGAKDGMEVSMGGDPLSPEDDETIIRDPASLIDTDKDGLIDSQEKLYGTDPNNPDTDGDSLTDGAEVNDHKSNPLDKDTDKGGVEDGAEVQRGTDPTKLEDDEGNDGLDDDSDGLTNGEEATAGTDPKNPDTDGDGLKDGLEVKKFNTDPKDEDSDDGGAKDGLEVSMGGDPLKPDDDKSILTDPESLIDTDNDGLIDAEETRIGTDPKNPDTDGDSLIDGAEVNQYKSNPLEKDTDKGGVEDGVEVKNGTNPIEGDDDSDDVRDDDGDGLTNTEESELGTDPKNPDTDGDGLRDGLEVNKFKTDPKKKDTDGGGMDDGTEVESGFDPLKADDDDFEPPEALLDVDGDGLLDSEEEKLGTDPNNSDTDGDGLDDGSEVSAHKTDPKKPDSDGDGLPDGEEVKTHKTDPMDEDTDGDALKDGDEVNTHKTDPTNVDSDDDGLKDGGEIKTYKTDPLKSDTDGDKLDDGDEVNAHKTDPSKPDTDGDSLSDGDEVNDHKTDPVKMDSDKDGLDDGDEVNTHKTDPMLPDSDEDRLPDGDEVNKYKTDPVKSDSDGDNIPDGDEVNDHKTDPTKSDSDGDGLPDGEEVSKYKTDPMQTDSDQDGLKDGDEVNTHKTDPMNSDTDGDKLPDGKEVTEYKTKPGSMDSDEDSLLDGDEVLTHKTNPLKKDTDGGGVDDNIEVLKGTNPVDNPQDDRAILGVVDGKWSPWTAWAKVDGKCIKGKLKLVRKRSCTNPAPAKGGKECIDLKGKPALSDYEYDTEDCEPEPGTWGAWGAWEEVGECVDFKQKFVTYRTCTPNPDGLNECLKADGSYALKDERYTTRKCTPPPVHGGWMPWEKWQPVGVCDINTKKKKYVSARRCANPAPAFGGNKCRTLDGKQALEEEREVLRACTPAPIHGAWGLWSKWEVEEACNVKTFKQKLSRTRLCNSPAPQFGGRLCRNTKGVLDKAEKVLTYKSCKLAPINGKWSAWGKWSDVGACNVKTLKQLQVRSRSCSNPLPQFGGKQCTTAGGAPAMNEEATRSIVCKPPVVNGGWAAWSAWKPVGECNPKTLKQSYSGTRQCTNPAPKFGGQQCLGKDGKRKLVETVVVQKACKPKPINGGWNVWGAWKALGTCSVEGKIRYIRYRACNKPLPQFGGKTCANPIRLLPNRTPAIDSQIVTKTCTPPVGVWEAWSAKVKSGACTNGIQKYKQVRSCKGPGICKNKKGEPAKTEILYSSVSCAGTWGAWSAYVKKGSCTNGKQVHARWRGCAPQGKLCKATNGKWSTREDAQITKTCTVAPVCSVVPGLGTALPPANIVQSNFKRLSGGYFHKMYLPQTGTQNTTANYSQWKQFITFEKCVQAGKTSWKVKDYTSPVRAGEVYGVYGFTGNANDYRLPCLMNKNGQCVKKWLDGKNHGYSSCMYRVHNGGALPPRAGQKTVNGRKLLFCDLGTNTVTQCTGTWGSWTDYGCNKLGFRAKWRKCPPGKTCYDAVKKQCTTQMDEHSTTVKCGAVSNCTGTWGSWSAYSCNKHGFMAKWRKCAPGKTCYDDVKRQCTTQMDEHSTTERCAQPPEKNSCAPKIHNNNLVSVEAECFSANASSGGNSWAKIGKGGASGGHVMQSTPDRGTARQTSSSSPKLSYRVNFPSSGRYTVWVRGWGDADGSGQRRSAANTNGGGSRDSVHVGINGNLSTAKAMDNFPNNRYNWSNDRRGTGSKAYINVPSAGSHTVNVWMREDGFVFDKLIFSKGSYNPSGLGPN